MEDLKSIKINLRGLVITNPDITIDQLDEEYKEMIGNSIPFVEMGFETLYEFLTSLTDTFLVFYLKFNHKFELFLIDFF